MPSTVARTVARTTPYPWPYDGAFPPERAALVLVVAADGPEPEPCVAMLADTLQAAGGVVVLVTTAPPRRGGDPAAGSAGARAPVELPSGVRPDTCLQARGTDGFFGSPLDSVLRTWGRDRLLVAGSWLETSVHSTLRSANDRGYECLLVFDACTAFDPTLRAGSRSQIEMSGGIFGAVSESADVLAAITAAIPLPERNLR